MGWSLFGKGMRQSGTWVRDLEPTVLRVVSLGFSMGSAHAIRWFFSPLDGADRFQSGISWIISIGFGVLGYFVSRGLAHRMMQKESIWAYAPICVVVEFVEIFCNYALAASMIANAFWLDKVPDVQRAVLTFMTYAVLSAIPLVSMLLAVVDMDMERRQTGKAQPKQPSAGSYPSGTGTYGRGYSGVNQGAGQGAGAAQPRSWQQGGASRNGASMPPLEQVP